MLTFRENMALCWGEDTWKNLDWVWKTKQTQDYFLEIRTRLYNCTSDNTKDDWVTALDCYDPFIDSWDYAIRKLLILMGYRHWNQYYFDTMELDKLNGLVKKAIKELAVDVKLEQMNEDFAETKIIETPLTTPKYITILE